MLIYSKFSIFIKKIKNVFCETVWFYKKRASGICRQEEAVIYIINSYNSKVSLMWTLPNLQYFKRIENNKTNDKKVFRSMVVQKKQLQLIATRGKQVSIL